MSDKALVGILMGSHSDWEVMKSSADTLEKLAVPHEVSVISAHRAPDVVFEYAQTAQERGLEVIIAGAGMAAALPGVVAAKTTLPVIGVPLVSGSLGGVDALYSIVQMPPGVPVGTVAVGKAGATNAAYYAAAILGIKYPQIRRALEEARQARRAEALAKIDPRS